MSSPPTFTNVSGMPQLFGDRLRLRLLDAVLAEVEAEGAHVDAGLLQPARRRRRSRVRRRGTARPRCSPLSRFATACWHRAADVAHRRLAVVERRVDLLAQREVGRDGEPAVLIDGDVGRAAVAGRRDRARPRRARTRRSGTCGAATGVDLDRQAGMARSCFSSLAK